MGFSENTSCISPIKMNKNSVFKFECHSKISCFTLCCKGINITLTPYDVIQLKNRLELSSRDFLALYTKPYLLEKTDLPMISLKLLDDKEKTCPFLKSNEENRGCMIYGERPTACRYYPLGVASLQYGETETEGGFFFFVNESHCKGFKESKKWSVTSWREDQAVKVRDSINARWMDLIVRKRSFPPNIKLREQAKHMFFLASYDIDKFREFVFHSSFLQHYSVDKETIELIKDNEIELLDFGLLWLKKLLFKENNFSK